jgi:hypothetical protein
MLGVRQTTGAMTSSAVLFRCGTEERRLALSTRDVCLLDAEYFFPAGAAARQLLGLDFVKGLGAPPTGRVLCTHKRVILAGLLESLLQALADQQDLLSYSYAFRFSDGPHSGESCGGSLAGFTVGGLHGYVTVRPSGYCYATLSEIAPTGRGRVVQVLDLRTRGDLATDDWGSLMVQRRGAHVGWFEALPPVLEWLEAATGSTVDVLHA